MLNNLIYNTDWHQLLNIQNGSPIAIDSMVNTFYNAINSFMDICVPKLPIIKQSGPPWSSRQLSKLKNKKNKLFKKYKDTGFITDYGKYSICRAEYNFLNTSLYNKYINKVKNNFKHNPKSFYDFVNSNCV